MSIKEKRISVGMTQEKLAELLKVSTRTIRRYENGQIDKYKYEYILKMLEKYSFIDEDHGIVKYDDIINAVNKISESYSIEFIYLFGSYAINQAKETSDIDLLIETEEKDLRYYGLLEDLRNILKKRIDFFTIENLINNKELLVEILKKGIKIYG